MRGYSGNGEAKISGMFTFEPLDNHTFKALADRMYVHRRHLEEWDVSHDREGMCSALTYTEFPR